MRRAARYGLMGVGAVAATLLVFTGIDRVVERQKTIEEINRLRDGLYRARVSADRCRSSLQTSEASLRDLGLAIDSVKARVDSFEALDRRGVPVERYPEYLELFDEYNDSVTVWEGREDRLRTAEAACRETIQGHNALADSLQKVLEAAGIDTGSES